MKKKSGFTIVEMMVTLVISVVIFGVLFSFLLAGQRSWHTEEGYIQVGQEARRAMGRMTRRLRGSEIISCTAGSVTFCLNSNTNTYTIDSADINNDGLTNQIVYFGSGGTNVVANFIEDVSFTNGVSGLTIGITASKETLQGDTVANTVSGKITLRNQ